MGQSHIINLIAIAKICLEESRWAYPSNYIISSLSYRIKVAEMERVEAQIQSLNQTIWFVILITLYCLRFFCLDHIVFFHIISDLGKKYWNGKGFQSRKNCTKKMYVKATYLLYRE